ncbi:MAG TPA: class I SAM-dependent methyltransferase [Thermoanaerobaculia bacterium]|nr:class I SAM-dependent methyltransferase [Thermoanaerobaculia bacterium]
MTRCCDLEGVARFSDRAAFYARARPSYPPEAIAFVRGNAKRIVDVGAGTGISTRLLSATGVDPNFAMLLAADDALPRVQARAEVLPFRDASIDLVAAFNSFHWFQTDAFFDEARRVLRRDGRLALVWNDWDRSDAFTREFEQLMRSCAPPDFPPEDREAEVAPLYATKRFTDIERATLPHRHRLDYQLLEMRLQSMTYVPKAGAEWERVARELAELFARYADADGFVEHHYFASVFVSR